MVIWIFELDFSHFLQETNKKRFTFSVLFNTFNSNIVSFRGLRALDKFSHSDPLCVVHTKVGEIIHFISSAQELKKKLCLSVCLSDRPSVSFMNSSLYLHSILMQSLSSSSLLAVSQLPHLFHYSQSILHYFIKTAEHKILRLVFNFTSPVPLPESGDGGCGCCNE